MNSDLEILVNPYTAMRLFARSYVSFGNEVLTSRRFKVTREAWIASMFLIATSEYREEWWFTPVKDSGSPDFNCYSMYIDQNKSQVNRSHLKLEVFEWRTEQKEENFLEALKTIKLNKIIDPEITIVCYIRRDAKISPAIELNKEIKKIAPKVKDIWYIGNTSADGKMWQITQIFPNTVAFDLDYDKVLMTKEKNSFIFTYRGKSEKMDFEPTGKQVQLSPEFELKLLDK